MSYGSDEWQPWVLNEAAALPLLKHAYDVGLNTWDTVRARPPPVLPLPPSLHPPLPLPPSLLPFPPFPPPLPSRTTS